jgi:hypothetical protein
MQAAGTLLRLPQELIAQSIIILYRFWTGADGGSLLEHDSKVCIRYIAGLMNSELSLTQTNQDVAAASLYLTAKPSAHPATPRQVLVVFGFLDRVRPDYTTALTDANIGDWTLSEGRYASARQRLYEIESSILRVLGFETHVALPYSLCVNYLQALDVFKTSEGSTVAKRCFAHLNSALLSPQLLYLINQPSAIATAAIYLAARDVEAKLPETEWWEVFDVDREELGFLVVALRSLDNFAQEERSKWSQRRVPLTIEDLRSEVERRQMLEDRE